MNWTNIRLIVSREIRDQLRDRRTIFVIAVLPLLLYPLLGMSFLQVAQFMKEHPTKIWIIGADRLPAQPALLDGEVFRPDLLTLPSDERLSSFEAKQLLGESGHSGDYRAEPADSLAAQLILQSWLQRP